MLVPNAGIEPMKESPIGNRFCEIESPRFRGRGNGAVKWQTTVVVVEMKTRCDISFIFETADVGTKAGTASMEESPVENRVCEIEFLVFEVCQ